MSGISVAKGDVLVLAPSTGLRVRADRGREFDHVGGGAGTSTVAVTTATPADAYNKGIVQALGDPVAAGANGTNDHPAGKHQRDKVSKAVLFMQRGRNLGPARSDSHA